MEVYILDSLWRRIDVIDVFNSLIWSDRKRDVGDFELIMAWSVGDKRRLAPGTNLAMSDSQRVMTVETVQDVTDENGVLLLKFSGRSLERILDSRLALASLSDTTTTPKWVLTGAPADIARQIFHDICVTGTLDTGDIIPYITEGSIMPADTIPEPTETITYEIEPQSVLSALKTICTQYLMGFRILRNGDTSELYFDIYMGSDRTASQTTLPAVVFSPDLDNLQNTTELTSTALYKNVAYVISPVGAEVVYPAGVDPTVAGFERNVLLVKADDITETDPTTATALMVQRGLQELSKNRVINAFDGELSQDAQFKEGVDYYLGDVIEVHNTTGSTDQMEVVEEIYISDSDGERSYPSVSLYSFVTSGDWLALPIDQNWLDLDAVLDWVDW